MTQTAAFVATLAIEVPFAVWICSRMAAPRPRLPDVALAAVAATACTHPLLFLADSALSAAVPTPARWAMLETAVVAAEALILAAAAGLGARRGVAVSAATNALSFAAGLAWYAWSSRSA